MAIWGGLKVEEGCSIFVVLLVLAVLVDLVRGLSSRWCCIFMADTERVVGYWEGKRPTKECYCAMDGTMEERGTIFICGHNARRHYSINVFANLIF